MKKIIIGFIAGAIFATAGTTMAQPVIEKITASIRTDYSVEVDGKKVELDNSPLAYNGSSYLPVREVSEMLGKEVNFKDGVIKLTTPIVDPVAELAALNRALEIQETNLKSVKGNEYINFDDMTPIERKRYDEAIKVLEEAAEETKQQIADLKAKYPELAAIETK